MKVDIRSMYFEKEGRENTDRTVELAVERARSLGIKEIVVASNTGETAFKLLEKVKDEKVIVVTHHAGFREPWKCEMKEEVRAKLEEMGAKVLTTMHALSGIERSFRNAFKGLYPTELVAEVLRLFGQGTKVCVEIAVMAADAGLLSGGKIVAIGGTGRGADTALVLTPAHTNRFLDMRIHEVICKPL